MTEELCKQCESELVVCVPGTRAQCSVYLDYLEEAESPPRISKPLRTTTDFVNTQLACNSGPSESATDITNTGIINRLQGEIVDIDQGEVMAKIVVKVRGNYICSMMPAGEFLKSGKQVGDKVGIAFKSVNVKLMV